MAPFARIRARITSSFRKAKGILAKIIYGEYFYDFTEQSTDGFVGAGEGETVINDYLTGAGVTPSSNYFTTEALSPSGAVNIDKLEVSFYTPVAIPANNTNDYVRTLLFERELSNGGYIILGGSVGALSTEIISFSTDAGILWYITSTDVASISIGFHTIIIEWNSGAGRYDITYDGNTYAATKYSTGSDKLVINNQAYRIMNRFTGTTSIPYPNGGYVQTLKMWDDSDNVILDFKNIYGANGTTYEWNGFTFTRTVGDATKRVTLTFSQYRIEDAGTAGQGYHLSPRTGIAASFDGSSVINPATAINLSGDFTIHFIADTQVYSSYSGISTANTNTDTLRFRFVDLNFQIRIDSNAYDFQIIDTFTPETTIQRRILTIVREGSDLTCYLNGASLGTTNSVSTNTFTIDNIGWWDTSGNYEFQGNIQDFLCINNALNSTQIQQLITRPELTKNYLVNTVGINWADVAAFYPLTENGGTTAYDYSDNANHGTYTNPAWETGLSKGRQLGFQNVSRYSYFGATGANQGIETSWFVPTTGIYTFRGSYIFTDDVDRYVMHAEKENVDFIVSVTNNYAAATGNIGIGIYKAGFKNYEFTGFESGDLIEWELVVNLDTEEPISATINGEFQSIFTTIQKIRAQGHGISEPLNLGGFLPNGIGRHFVGIIFYTEIEFEGSVVRRWVNKGKSSDDWKDEIIGEPVLTNTLTTEITLPEKETISGVPYDVFGLECNSKNLIGEEETFALRGLGYVDYDGHAGLYTDVKQIQFILITDQTDHAYILTDEENNRIAYLSGSQILSDFAVSSVYVNDVETNILLPNGNIGQQVTIEFTTPFNIEKLFIGSSAVPDAFEEFGIDKLNIVKE